ncbi:MAG: nucleotide pyrophosphohydrolase, partial [Pseudomonadales bacterium]|nr:nucleotide pyrophosphohydrolase [Pseudomonadales bacterium]
GVDILEAVARKSKLNDEKYPVEQVRGSAKKHDRY